MKLSPPAPQWYLLPPGVSRRKARKAVVDHILADLLLSPEDAEACARNAFSANPRPGNVHQAKRAIEGIKK